MSVNMLIPDTQISHVYNPNRDLAKTYVAILKEVGNRVLNLSLTAPALSRFVQEHKITQAELMDCLDALTRFYATANLATSQNADPVQAFLETGAVDLTENTRPLSSALQQAGFFKSRPEVTFVIAAVVGMVYVGTCFDAINDATLGMNDPCASLRTLIQRGRPMVEQWFRAGEA